MPMKLNQFAVYRVDQQTAGKALWHLPYQEARQQNVSITVENYRLVSIHEMQENEKVADIWKRMKKQCEVSDVLVLNKNGEISCYYVDENYPQYLAGFIRINTSGALITMETENYQIDGKKGNWIATDTMDFLQGIRSQTDKLDFLFQALVKTSRLETGAIRLEKKDSSLFHTLAQAMSSIVYAAEKKEIAVSVDCPENLIISHDSKWTSEALFNLLDNAVKYTPSGGKISVSVVQWEMYVEVKVTDTGKGISESNQAAIFRRFYREEEVHDQQGVGIGLYLAREIVTRQGGYIKVVSELRQGSEFSIMLPVR